MRLPGFIPGFHLSHWAVANDVLTRDKEGNWKGGTKLGGGTAVGVAIGGLTGGVTGR